MNSRLHVALFGALCAAGVVSSVGLTVREVLKTAPVVASVAHTDRSGLTTTVEVAVRNTTDSARCADVEVAARDRGGHDLGTPVTVVTGLQLAPHSRRLVPAQVTLTARDYAERLDRFYPSVQACSGAERGT